MFAIIYGLTFAAAAPVAPGATTRAISPCPASLRMPASATAAAHDGGYQPLDHVVVYHGPPANGAELRPSGGWERGPVTVEIHRSLNEAGEGLTPFDTWLVCHYGSAGTHRVEKALGTTVNQCVARYRRKGKSGTVLQAFTCTD